MVAIFLKLITTMEACVAHLAERQIYAEGCEFESGKPQHKITKLRSCRGSLAVA
jgi:hypothetical protein